MGDLVLHICVHILKINMPICLSVSSQSYLLQNLDTQEQFVTSVISQCLDTI